MISVAASKVQRDGEWYRAFIVSKDVPPETVTGADVDGMADTARLAAGSVICTPSGNYVAFEDEKFSKKNA